jgi:hypothetical protein
MQGLGEDCELLVDPCVLVVGTLCLREGCHAAAVERPEP